MLRRLNDLIGFQPARSGNTKGGTVAFRKAPGKIDAARLEAVAQKRIVWSFHYF